jgi:hypothetical protein
MAEKKCKKRLSKHLEHNFEDTGLRFEDVFYSRTWSLIFLTEHLKSYHITFWDYISVWYELTEEFATQHIDWLNFHDLIYYQHLNKNFYAKYLPHKLDWININDKEKRSKVYDYLGLNIKDFEFPAGKVR